jgi:hypothetical protein
MLMTRSLALTAAALAAGLIAAQALIAPLIASSQAFVHSKDIKIKTGSYNPFGAYMSDFAFK